MPPSQKKAVARNSGTERCEVDTHKTSAPLKFLIIGIQHGHNRSEWVKAFLENAEQKSLIKTKESTWRPRNSNRLPDLLSGLRQNLVSFFEDYKFVRKAGVIYVAPMNYSAYLYALILKKIARAKLLIDHYVFCTPTLELAGGVSCWMGGARKCRRNDMIALKMADQLIVPSQTEANLVCRMLGISPRAHVTRIPLMLELNASKTGARIPSTSSEKVHFIWWGHFAPLHGLPIFLDGIQQLDQAEKERIKLTLAASAGSVAYVKSVISDHSMADIEIDIRTDLTFASGTLPEFLTQEDVIAIGQFGDSNKSRHVMFNKIVEAIAFGLPVFTCDTPGVREFLSDKEALLCEASSDGVANRVRNILQGEIDFEIMLAQAKSTFEENFDSRNFDAQFRKMLESTAMHL